ncbi:MAG: hypothetical protein H6948_02040 [Zoogloeaceae bacterium]|nr:hypothetical protein [Gammaproteobacteria bacterium]MCP5230868.1 hypothetical protein [Zoogloeaceae bacterium]
MLVIFVSLLIAVTVSIVAALVNGVDALLTEAWIGTVFWSLIGVGTVIAGFNIARCMLWGRLVPCISAGAHASCERVLLTGWIGSRNLSGQENGA